MSFTGNRTAKRNSSDDGFQTLQGAFNEEDKSISIGSFLQSLVGRKVEIADGGASEVITFSENGVTLYVLTLTYTDASKGTLISAERTA